MLPNQLEINKAASMEELFLSNKDCYFDIFEMTCPNRKPDYFLDNNTSYHRINWQLRSQAELNVGFFSLNEILFHNGLIFKKHDKIQYYNYKWNNIHIDKLSPITDFDTTIHEKIEDCIFLPLPSVSHFKNYACWLTQIIPQINRFLAINPNSKILFPVLSCSWQRDILNFYFPNINIIEIDLNQNIYFSKVIIPIEKFPWNITINEYEFLNKKKIKTEETYKIYIARFSNKRNFINQSKIIDYLESKGFYIIEPHNFTFEQQYALMKSTTNLFGTGGSAMYNSIFSSPKTQLVSIETNFWAPYHAKLFSVTHENFGMVFGDESTGTHQDHNNFQIDLDRFKEFYETISSMQ
jgi:hypothetical protein